VHCLRRWRHSAALLVLCLTALGPLLLSSPLPTWTAGFHQARCVGPCCLIADGFIELSCGEYSPPAPAPPARAVASTSTGSAP